MREIKFNNTIPRGGKYYRSKSLESDKSDLCCFKDGVTNMQSTFKDCTSLVEVPIIPKSVTNMAYTFYGCTSLAGTIEINANPTVGYNGCFNSTKRQITLTGSSKMLKELAKTSKRKNIKVASIKKK